MIRRIRNSEDTSEEYAKVKDVFKFELNFWDIQEIIFIHKRIKSVDMPIQVL